MNLFVKLLIIPFAAFFAMMFTVAIIGSIYGSSGLKEILGGTSAMPVWYVWLCVLSTTTIFRHFMRKTKD